MTWAAKVAQVIECLPSKCEAQSLNPSITEKKKDYFYYSFFFFH
jgi:hypothetical protein